MISKPEALKTTERNRRDLRNLLLLGCCQCSCFYFCCCSCCCCRRYRARLPPEAAAAGTALTVSRRDVCVCHTRKLRQYISALSSNKARSVRSTVKTATVIFVPVYARTSVLTCGRTEDGWTDERTDRRTDGQTDGRTYRRTNVHRTDVQSD